MNNKFLILLILPTLFIGCGQGSKSIELQGKTERDEISVVGKLAGRIDSVWVAEGDVVRKGDTLAVLNIPEIDAKKAQALGAVEAAEAQYNMSVTGATKNQLIQLEAKKNALQEQYNYAEKSVNRLKNMVEDSLISQQTFDEAYAKFQGAKAQLSAVNAEIADVENGVRLEQQQMALGQRNRAQGALQEALTAENERFIIAPATMKIDNITLKAGELALPGYTLFKGVLPNTTYFRFTLPENDLDKIEKDMQISVQVVYNKERIDAYVSQVKVLPAYANIATAYPDYEMQQSLFEIIVRPKTQEKAGELFPKTNVTITL